MRIFLGSATGAERENERAFLNAYDTCFLWASDDVLQALGAFLDLQMEHAANPDPANELRMQALYGGCLTAMRKDAGFPDSAIDRTDYRVVRF